MPMSTLLTSSALCISALLACAALGHGLLAAVRRQAPQDAMMAVFVRAVVGMLAFSFGYAVWRTGARS